VDRTTFAQLAAFFLIPLGVVVISWLVQYNFKMRQSAATDLFAFIFALDVTLLVSHDVSNMKINPVFRPVYGPVFGVALVTSLILLLFAARVQAAIYANVARKRNCFYPLGRVIVCWICALASIAFHLFATLGG